MGVFVKLVVAACCAGASVLLNGADAKGAGASGKKAETVSLARISQKKYVGIMDGTLESKIILVADSSGKNIRWQAVSPYESVSILKGGVLYAFEKIDGKWVEVNSAVRERAGKVFEMVADMLAGRRKTPEGFVAKDAKDGAQYVPESEALAKVVAKISVFKNRETGAVSKVRMDAPDGDWTELSVESVEKIPLGNGDFFDASKLDIFKKSGKEK